MEPQIQMQGNLVADPTTRVTASGLVMTRFRIASSGRRWDRSRNEFVSTEPVYMSVVCWRQLAENVANSVHKGDTGDGARAADVPGVRRRQRRAAAAGLTRWTPCRSDLTSVGSRRH